MRRTIVFLLASCLFAAAQSDAASLLLISIDGLPPSYVTDADRLGLRIPQLRTFVTQGTHARGVVGVLPTVTYPNHTTIVTGTLPAEHGIVSNMPFDPMNTNRDGWYWYAQDIRVPTLWSAAAKAGLSTASVNWPVSVGDRNVTTLLPEYWRVSNEDDLKLLRALSRPEGRLAALEGKLGPFIDGNVDTLESDEIRTRFALAVLKEDKPRFMGVHLIALDGTEHREGPNTPEAFRVLEALDGMVGELVSAALANDPETVLAIVSDHGFIATHTMVNLRTAFVSEGLIELALPSPEGAPVKVKSWQAQVWPGGATAAVVLRDRADQATRTRVAGLLKKLAADPKNGVAVVLDAKALATKGAFPGADFVVEFQPGFYLGNALTGALLTPGTSRGTHGYLPDRPEMHATFLIRGRGIAAGRKLDVIDMRAIAPTLARVLGVSLPSAREPALQIFEKEAK